MTPRFDVFVYGTLMDRDVLAAVLNAPKIPLTRLTPATLNGHRRFALKGRAYPSLAPDADSMVQGLVFQGCTPREWQYLLAYEDVEYTCATVRVEVGQGQDVAKAEARVFLGGPQHLRLDAGHDWSFDFWTHRHKRHYVRRLSSS